MRVRQSRDRGVNWILSHIDSTGEPVGSRTRNGWARVPWALAVCGEREASAAVIAWAMRDQIADNGGFAVGAALGTGRFFAYPLAHFAIGAWLTERFDIALRAMDVLRCAQDPVTGGLPIALPVDRASDCYDLLSTAQTGLAAVITGQDDIADLAYQWTTTLNDLQPLNAGSRLFTFRKGAVLLVEPDQTMAWLAITDFSRARQSFYTPGMAAAFLGAYAQRRNISHPLTLADRLLQFNLEGTPEQFSDKGSVQICKFGWGSAVMLAAHSRQRWLPQVVRMSHWFIDHQETDGAWAPSQFLAPTPTDIDKLVKTAEHVMEINAILGALGTSRIRTDAAD